MKIELVRRADGGESLPPSTSSFKERESSAAATLPRTTSFEVGDRVASAGTNVELLEDRSRAEEAIDG